MFTLCDVVVRGVTRCCFLSACCVLWGLNVTQSGGGGVDTLQSCMADPHARLGEGKECWVLTCCHPVRVNPNVERK